MNTDAIRDWHAAKLAAAEADKTAKDLKAERDRLGEIAIEAMLEAGVPSLKLQGIGTVSVVNTPRARALDHAALIAALREIGRGDMASVNPQTLSSWVRESQESGDELPLEVAAAIDIYEQTQIRVRKS